ncbi:MULTISPECIES: GtrA family protein [Vibrio]|uniref:GtrA family protein n=5 Tax=Vibrio TaxID=662 RepID=A0A2N7NPQ5_9VIBR|nr:MULTISPECIES: GtrA family protein [Vibrio]OEF67705.1 polysaccharide biosynthesis protein GtrA [Vibrio tasmaniensis 1F-187]PMP18896.1 polysaccharide biosynthesis protein GtrA [Vibrio tasmaniensis]TKG30924.1 GtrA family protein [Vibrio tasmaniensis]TKG40209.1 GtrA family protein [Vibrio tasmaniensis]TKG45965.1 GtrA family protein [Vibrio tasmaniensis]
MFSVNSRLRMFNDKLQSHSQRLQSHHKMVRFAVVGVGGFVVDCLVFALLHYVVGLPLMMARISSFIAAATTTWLGNRILTFEYKGRGHWSEKLIQWQKFMFTASISAVPNLLCFKLMTELLPTFIGAVFIAMAVGTLVGMVTNYLFSQYWVFTR